MEVSTDQPTDDSHHKEFQGWWYLRLLIFKAYVFPTFWYIKNI